MGFANQVKVTAKLLNCRLEPSYNGKVLNAIKMNEVHNIVVERDGWGLLENGSWINLTFTAPCKNQEKDKDILEKEEKSQEISEIQPELKEEPVEAQAQSQNDVAAKEKKENIEEKISKESAVHKVKPKETLQDIAEFWYGKGQGHRYTEIKQFNNLKSDILRANTLLKIPNINV